MDVAIEAAAPERVAAPKRAISTVSAVLLAAVFLISGVWKIVDTYTAATLMIQAKVPGALGIPAALGFGIVETVAGLFLLAPRFRRWGAWLTGALLVAFIVYIGYHYSALVGQECSCFPWIKRTVGPGFFIGDGLLLLMTIPAAMWSRRSYGLRNGMIVAGAVAVFAFVSFGVAYARQTGIKAPDTIVVDGQPYTLLAGKHFLYFFDPECSHCYQAAQAMSKYQWKGVRVIGVPTAQPRFAAGFMKDTGLKAPLSPDAVALKKLFPYIDPPFGVAIENGRQKASFIFFDANEPVGGLKKIGFVE